MFKRFFRKKKATEGTFEEFWHWFSSQESKFKKAITNRKDIEESFLNPLKEAVDKLAPNIFFLAGLNQDKEFELIFTPDGNLKTVCYVEDLVNSSPNLSGWKFIALKPPTPSNQEFGINMYGHEFRLNDMFFVPVKIEFHPDLIKLVIVYQEINDENKNNYSNAIYILLENFIGEYNLMTQIDEIDFANDNKFEKKDLVPISKLREYLNWRQKEFLEKYEGIKYSIEDDEYSILEFESNEEKAVAVINKDLINWDKKASHPWLLIISINFEEYNYDDKWDKLDSFEDDLNKQLLAKNGFLNVGRRTGSCEREIFWANKDFRQIVKVIDHSAKQLDNGFSLQYDLFKDKYWQTLEIFNID